MISTTLTSSRSLSARSEIQKLAGDIDEFVYEYDTYEYKDVVEDREDNIASIIRSLECDQGLGERCYLSGIIHEDDPNEEFTKKAADLLDRIYAVLNITNMEVQSL